MRLWATFVCLCCVTASPGAGTAAGARGHFPQVIALRRATRNVSVVDGNDLQFRRLRASLLHNHVGQIVQDQKGFMWFGTRNGLNRYDGYEVKTFSHDPLRDDSLSGVYIFSLLEDRAHALWVGSDEFLDRLDPVSGRFARFVVDREAGTSSATNIYCATEDASGVIWLCTRNGLHRLDPITSQTKLFRHDPNVPSTLASSEISSAGEDRQGNFWVGTSAGLDLFDRSSQTVISHLPLSGSEHRMSFHEDRFGTFWIIYGTQGRLAVFDRRTSTLTNWLPVPETRTATATPIFFSTMIEDRDGVMWFGTLSHGILKFDRGPQRFIRYMARPSDPDGLSDRRVSVLYQDREGLIWAGLHQAQPNYFVPRPPAFQRFRSASQESAMVSAILQDHVGNVWLGLDRGLRLLRRDRGLYEEIVQFNSDETTSMVESSPGVFWIGTAGQGLKRYDERTGRVTSYRNDPSQPTSLPSNFIDRVAQDLTGAVWAVTWAGLARWNAKTNDFTTYMPERAPWGLNFITVSFAHDGTIWIGSNLGLYRYDPGRNQFTLFQHDANNASSLSNDRVNAIHETGDGTLWIGTQNGLDHLAASGVVLSHFTERNGLTGNTVSCILEDRDHRLWMSTNRGISRLDAASGYFEAYGIEDGLPGPDMTGWGACSQADSGEMFFAGFSGATAFFPDKVTDSPYVPPVVLTNARIYDSSSRIQDSTQLVKPLSYATELVLLPWQNKFSIEFSALSFLSPESNRFRYRMQHLQDEWTEVNSNQRTATYLAMPPGSYVFEVQGATRHGSWNTSGATLNILMLPPWWQRWPIRLFAFLMVGFAVLVSYRLRMRQLAHAYNLRLEERVAERTRIARELHDTLLQGFQGLMFRLQAVRDLLPTNPDRAIPVLDTALLNGEDAIDKARNAVSGLRSPETIEQDFVSGLAAIAAGIVKGREDVGDTPCELMTIGQTRRIPTSVLYELYQVAHEALNNAVRHSQAKQIKVEVRYGGDALRVRFVDDGIGMDTSLLVPDGARRRWGLIGMKERVEKLGGKLSLRSQPSNGTEVAVWVPAAVAYATGSFAVKVRKLLTVRRLEERRP